MANGMLHSTDTGSGFFIDGVEIPIATLGEKDIYGNPYEFDRYGNLKPIFEDQVAIEEEPRFMLTDTGFDPVEVEQSMHDQALQEAEQKKASEIAAAGKAYWDAVMQGAIEFLSGGMMSTPKDEGRRQPIKIENLRGEKPGWEMAEGSNFWSVNEKDPYWQTKEGFKEVMNLYGTKPSWVKEPSLEYNPKTGEYDPIEKEEFVEIKPKKRISL
jgi:hypothetical protein